MMLKIKEIVKNVYMREVVHDLFSELKKEKDRKYNKGSEKRKKIGPRTDVS